MEKNENNSKMMNKKTIATLFLASMAGVAQSAHREWVLENEVTGEGQFRMDSGIVKTQKGSLVDSIRDTQFKLSSQTNTHPLSFDSMRIFKQETQTEQQLKAKIH